MIVARGWREEEENGVLFSEDGLSNGGDVKRAGDRCGDGCTTV
jgi:hypothetical protein